MRADLDHLLTDAASDPTTPIDTDQLWAAGRRRRLVRRASTVSAGMASVAIVAVVIGAIGLNGPATPEVAPVDEPEETEDPVTEDVDDAEVDEAAVEDPAPAVPDHEVESDEQQEPETDTAEEQPDAVEEDPGEVQAAEEPGPTPDAAALADPCAGREGGMESFIDVVGPVNGQAVNGEIELVGCSSVYEATVRYRLLQGNTVLIDSFTTATAGGPDIGEFRETIRFDATGPLTLQVFWDSPADGSEQDLVSITVQAS